MLGSMMDVPLTLGSLLERARTFFPGGEVVTRLADGSLVRHRYDAIHRRVCRLAGALRRLGCQPGDRVASLCWNHHQHLELYFAVPALGAVLHTLNLRLHPDELGYIANHARDRFLFVDRSLLPLCERFRAEVSSIERVVVIDDEYEQLLAAERDDFAFPTLDERQAALMCYTSGTTGRPKGVVYSHRSTMLHTMALCMVDTKGVCQRDTIMPVVPMFHANAWGLPYAAVATGAHLVMPGPNLTPEGLLDLLGGERVTLTAGVPTIWLGALALLDREPRRWDLSALRLVAIGGSAAPPALIAGLGKHGLEVVHAWGMTETNPLATVARVKRGLETLAPADALALRAKQGYAILLIEQRHVDDQGRTLPWDGQTMGELEVRGPWVAASYYGGEGADRFTADGWFKTGDVVTIDAEGYVHITDRAKDVIKSGGEWISTQALENALMAHAAVLEAAVFAGEHPKWDERPIAAVVLKPGAQAEPDELLRHLEGQFPKWWLPDAFLFLDEVPRTSTGKFHKRTLRERYGRHLLEPK